MVVVAAVVRGGIVAAAICLPLALVSRQVLDDGDGSPLAPALLLAVLIGFAVGGFVAARVAGTAPFTNGGLAALAAFVAIQGVAAILLLLDGDVPSAPALVFNAVLAFGSGLAGGAVAARTRRRTEGQAS